MQNSLIRFQNKPSKQFPLDNKVWKLQYNASIKDEPLITEESEYNFQNEIKRVFNDTRCQQYTCSMIINNYTVHSVSQASDRQIDSDLYLEQGNNQFNQYQFKPIFQ
ncbi:unnamed protein product [Paramecium sonneborni]|uniref:Uncharacterized protein n=1 Tax=Paramecium sonneborni TaxID=65129 RepID=A0A8S1QZ77_9CILI|nr:unnamed protein product [Paramecium sonneborni]